MTVNDSQLFNDALLHMAQDTSVGQAFLNAPPSGSGNCSASNTFVGLIDEVTQISQHTGHGGRRATGGQHPVRPVCTPCANVVGNRCVYTCRVPAIRTTCLLLQQMGWKVISAPIFDAQVKGITCWFYSTTKPQQDSPQRRSVVQLYAARAGAEIDHACAWKTRCAMLLQTEQQVRCARRELRGGQSATERFLAFNCLAQ